MQTTRHIASISAFRKLRSGGLMLAFALLFAATQFSNLDHNHSGGGLEASCSVCLLAGDSPVAIAGISPTLSAQNHSPKRLLSSVSTPQQEAFAYYSTRAPPVS